MYRKDKPISLKSSTSSLCNNLSVFVNTEKGSLNYAVVHKYLVNIVSSTTDGSQVTNRQVVCKEPSQQGHSMIMQVPVYSVLSIPLCFSFAFHPDKCSAIRISRSRKSAPMNYTLKGHVLQNEDYTRYLGVELQSNLSWNRHIDQTVKKANIMLGFLRRNLRVSNESTKTSAYRSMVRPLLEYCSTVWSPYTQEHIQKIEMVQLRAARYVTNRYHITSSVTSMLDHLEWETLESRRTKNQLVMFFKFIHGLIDIPAERYLTPASTRTRSHHSLKYRQIPTSSDYHKYSFFPNTVCLWNSLPANVAEAPGLVPFKRELCKMSF